jgi:uncharacterized protein YciI
MPYLILALDHDDKDNIREAMREAHRAYLKKAGKRLLASGALMSGDGESIVGGMSLLDTEDYDEAEQFANNDPYAGAGIRRETQIIRWRKRWWDGQFLG